MTSKIRLGCGFGVLLAAAAFSQDAPGPASGAPLPETIQFNRDIRPILSDRCFTCHGPDQGRRVTAFHFDVEESAKQDVGGGRYAIIPGDVDNSLLIQRVTATEDALRMPPASTGPRLSTRQVEILKKWIEQGATWEKHWSFETPQRPELPPVADSSWARNAIDNFVLRRLEKEGLKPSPEADRATLLRRVTLDLTGRGPTIAELDTFLADKSPNAYEKVVDRLLSSPQYGERMAVPWLDAARYADTNGYQQDHDRYMWRWRDWVINAFNRNMPFDQFTIEQLAGDLLPNPTLDQKIATGFNRNHRTNAEGGIIPAEFAAEYVVDRVSTTASVFLGVTMGCARCHDHKYDPFSQKEFYQLFAYFNNVPEYGHGRRGNSNPYIKAPTQEQAAELKRLDDRLAAAKAKFSSLEPSIDSAAAAWVKSLAGKNSQDWAPTRGLIAYEPMDGDLRGVVKPDKADGEATPTWQGQPKFANGVAGQAGSFDGSTMIEVGDVGQFTPTDKFSLGAWIYPTEASGPIVNRFKGEVKEGGSGYSLQLTDGKVEMIFAFRVPDHTLRVITNKPIEINRWHHVMATFGGVRESRSFTIYVDGEPQAVSTIMDILNETASVSDPFRIGGVSDERFKGLIDEARLYNDELSAEEVGILATSRSLSELAAIAPSQWTKSESAKVRHAFLDSGMAPAELLDAYRQFADAKEKRAGYYESIPTTMVMEEMPTPRETHVLLRGAYDSFGDIVTPDVPSILPPIPSDYPKNRLGLAQWLVSPSNPLTARVTVNRFWQMYFGTGIVKTVDDFGSQGDLPSHPELLDWLATEFVRSGWDVKQMQKTIVMSATYAQDSAASSELVQRDPENRLLAHGPRFRLPAETVRDHAISIAGLLVEKVGGPSVKTYQPEGLWTDLAQLTGEYVQDHGDSLYRRSLYAFWKRTIPPPSMSNFDAPSRESCILLRGSTNSPLQALDLMNDVTYMEASRMLAERMMKEGGSTAQDRIAFGFRLATSRLPNSQEMHILADSFRYSLDEFQTRPDAAAQYLTAGEHPRDETLDVPELAAYTNIASLIINLDEAVSKQ